MGYSKYTKLTLITIFIIILLSFLVELLHFNFTSTEGDLTRIGMHSESDYGNNEMEYFFNPALSQKSSLSKIGDFDVVVIGDSFSTNRFSRAWHNYLQSQANLSVGVFDITKYSLDDIINSTNYKKSPPKILIYESVERNLPERIISNISIKKCSEILTMSVEILPEIRSIPIKPQLVEKATRYSLEIDRGMRYLKNLFKYTKKTTILELSSTELFTNSHADRLLIFSEDISKKKKLSELDWTRVRCGLLELQRKVQHKGETKFVALIAPDKLTTYSKYLKNKHLKNFSKYQYLMNDSRLNIVPLLPYFEMAHKNNKKDIYFPNDTHWSSVGNKLVGNVVLDYLKNGATNN